MQALLIATGESQKLKPLTDRVPSPMVPVMNRPVMLYNLELLGRLHFKRILVSVYQMASAIERYFGDGQRWGLSLEYILQREPLGSAGALWRARSRITEPVLVMPADEIADLEMAQAIEQHAARRALATVVVQPFQPNKGRTLFPNWDGHILSVEGDLSREVPALTDTGIYLIDPQILERIPSPHPFEIHDHLLPQLLAEGVPVCTSLLPGYWNPLETLQHYAEAQHVFLSRALKGETPFEKKITYHYHFVDTRPVGRGIWVGHNSKIHPEVKIYPPVSIGHNTWIDREVELGPDAVIGSNIMIDQGATIQHSTILDNTYVGKLVKINHRLVNQDQVVDLCTNDHVLVKDTLLLGKVSSQVFARGIQRFLDIFLAFFLLLLSLPLTLVLALLLWISTGHVFQKLPCWPPRSFRGSNLTGDKDSYNLLHFYTHPADGRETWLGTWLERWEGYRLPELLSVLRGDLAMIGLKPAMTEIEYHYLADLPSEYQEIPAGFTGLWYVQTDDESVLEETTIADAFYCATRNWKRDWWILWNTPAAWYRKTKRRFARNQNHAEGTKNGNREPIGG